MTKIKFTILEWELLACANEDAYGLRELLNCTRTLHPTMSEKDILSMTRDATGKLLNLGLIYICWFRHTTNEENEIPLEEANRLLQADSTWGPIEPGTGQLYLAVLATEDGRTTWQKSPHPANENGHNA